MSKQEKKEQLLRVPNTMNGWSFFDRNGSHLKNFWRT